MQQYSSLTPIQPNCLASTAHILTQNISTNNISSTPSTFPSHEQLHSTNAFLNAPNNLTNENLFKHPSYISPYPDVEGNRLQWAHSINEIHNILLSQSSVNQLELTIEDLHEISECIFHGITLPFRAGEIPANISFNNTFSVQQHIDEVRQTLQEYKLFGAIEEIAEPREPKLVQPLHVVIKPGKAPRVCIDLSRNLNNFLPEKHFHYTSVEDAVNKSKQNCWYAKLDISKCYLSFALAPEVRKYFTFSLDDKYYRFTRLPFGLSSGPRLCTLILSIISFELTKLGINHVRYLDDFLFIASSKEECQIILDLAINLFRRFGLVINLAKTCGPTQIISFLGIIINSIDCLLECTQERIEELLALLKKFSLYKVVRVHSIESLVGKLSFAATVLPGARPFMRRMFDLIRGETSRSRVRIDQNFHLDIEYWFVHLQVWNGRQQWRQNKTPIILVSDASLDGFGFYCEQYPLNFDAENYPNCDRISVGNVFSGRYSPEHAEFHSSHRGISWCELFAALNAMCVYAPLLQNQSVLLVIDNKTDVDIINRQSTRSLRLGVLLRAMFDFSTSINCSIKAIHRAGDLNILADFLSRPKLHQDDIVNNWAKVTQNLITSSVLYANCICSAQMKLVELQPRRIGDNSPKWSKCLVNFHWL